MKKLSPLKKDLRDFENLGGLCSYCTVNGAALNGTRNAWHQITTD